MAMATGLPYNHCFYDVRQIEMFTLSSTYQVTGKDSFDLWKCKISYGNPGLKMVCIALRYFENGSLMWYALYRITSFARLPRLWFITDSIGLFSLDHPVDAIQSPLAFRMVRLDLGREDQLGSSLSSKVHPKMREACGSMLRYLADKEIRKLTPGHMEDSRS